MIRITFAVVAALLANASALKVSNRALARSKFMSVMNDVSKEHGLERRVSQVQLTKKILSKSKSSDRNLRKSRTVRELEDAAADNESSSASASTDDAASSVSTDDASVTQQSTDDASVTVDDQYDNAYAQDDAVDYSDIFFDLSKFSIKFHSCASFAIDYEDLSKDDYGYGNGDGNGTYYNDTYYEEEEEEEANDGIVYPYTTTQVVNYRLCPSDTCNDDSWKGCRSTYGNYMITLQDYFEAQEEYIESVFEQYCDYCSQCQYMYKYFNAKCSYYDECSEYGSVCYEQEEQECDGDDANCEQEEEEEEITYDTFLECTEVDVLEGSVYYNYCGYCQQCDYFFSYFKAECKNYANCNGYKKICYTDDENQRRLDEGDAAQKYYDMEVTEKVYLKLYCDGSLKVGMFADNQCTTYISDKIDMYNTTGLSFTADDISSTYMTDECITCSRKNTKYFHGYGNNGYNNYNNNGDENENEEDDDMLEICEKMYEDSVKCNENLALNMTAYYSDDAEVDKELYEEWSETVKENTCAVIEAVQKGELDKYGHPSTSNKYRPASELESISSYVNKKTEYYTNTINEKYMPEGYVLTQGILSGIIAFTFVALLFGIASCLFKKPKRRNEDLDFSLVKNEGGVSA